MGCKEFPSSSNSNSSRLEHCGSLFDSEQKHCRNPVTMRYVTQQKEDSKFSAA